ncbi:Csu type fimbrial protein [Limibacillus halophilus]|uniref:Spore coat protein U-like protein n=1 Tax=Limibacillus halophilus TaxID=1579333 RepID=A0A839SXW0_9PROT|nr:spore coat protein U domain-containing protein [Limibacillus halophilus]MBB3066510.1 spore coat protein U-like protein [Limibacillus halophilus]
MVRNPISNPGLGAIVALVLLLFSAGARAECSVSSSTQDIGAIPSDQLQNTQVDFTLSTGFSCNVLASVGSEDRIEATLLGSTNNLALNNGSGGSLPFALFLDSARSQPFNVNDTVAFGGSELLSLFSAAGGAIPIYLTTALGNVPAGSYSDSLSLRWVWDVCDLGGAGDTCVTRSSGDQVVSLTITLVVSPVCGITAAELYDFGTATLMSAVDPLNVPISIDCTLQQSYKLYLDGGDNQSGGRRRMVGAGGSVKYNIFAQDGVTPVGPKAKDSLSGLGSGFVQSFNLLAKVDASQGSLAAGLYEDRVRIVVEY